MPIQPFEEIFKVPITNFQRHLEINGNKRILFSGKFGIGKSMFLDYVFNNEASPLKDQYEVYTLFPVDYSIASNEDIIKYIKYDIITEFLRKGKNINEVHLGFLSTLPAYAIKNLDKIAAAIIYMVPKIGKEVTDIYEKVDELIKDFQKFKKEINESDADKMANYLSEMEAKEGLAYENDIITNIISNVVADSGGKQSVLVVEDLDRLDPEHIFRILNVFAAHLGYKKADEQVNKFNFDKIILVCDVHNIRNLFHHKYGVNADFNGYIDKFYSTEIFFIDNKSGIKNILQTIFNSVDLSGGNHDYQSLYSRYFFGNGFLENMVTCLIERSFINLRSVIKTYQRQINFHLSEIKFSFDARPIRAIQGPLIPQLRLLAEIAGGFNVLLRQVQQLMDDREELEGYERYFSQIMGILSFKSHSFFQIKRIFI